MIDNDIEREKTRGICNREIERDHDTAVYIEQIAIKSNTRVTLRTNETRTKRDPNPHR